LNKPFDLFDEINKVKDPGRKCLGTIDELNRQLDAIKQQKESNKETK